MFYFAFLPQFIDPAGPRPALAMLAFGGGFALLTFVMKAPVGLFAGLASSWIRSRPGVLLAINRASGGVLIALGLKLAFEQR